METLDNRDSVPKYWNVYIHINRINGKTYVGITSKDLIRRFGCQGQGYKGQAFWGAIQKYGWENFDHIIVKDNISMEEAQFIEQLLIDKLNSHISKDGYNVTLGGEGYKGCDNHGENNPMYGKHHSEKTKQLISMRNKGTPSKFKGMKRSEEDKLKMRKPHYNARGAKNYRYGKKMPKDIIDATKKATCKPVVAYDMSLNFISEYESISEAERKTGIHRAVIRSCCDNIATHGGDFLWFYKSSEINAKTLTDKLNKYLGKVIKQYDENMNEINEYKSLAKAEEYTGIDRHSISKSCKTGSLLKGFYWKTFNYMEGI